MREEEGQEVMEGGDILSNGNTGIGRPQTIGSILTGTQNTTDHGQGPWPSLNPMVS